jgi:hypothetical protein
MKALCDFKEEEVLKLTFAEVAQIIDVFGSYKS